jgi:DNA-binding response OmpR family regulator
MTERDEKHILLVGQDPSLEYLLTRYGQHNGCRVHCVKTLSAEVDLAALPPQAIWFASLEGLEAHQAPGAFDVGDVPIVVCAALIDQTRALKAGADYVLPHPVTYDLYLSTFMGIGSTPKRA